ncbi:MAG: hypothetical protein J0G30_11595 [Actinomycetales bacterium]|nr:hypothetical protein [Actinomycetales bacterium]
MSRWPQLSPERRAALEEVRDEFLHNAPRGRRILAVDGPDGAGKSRFAADLVLAFERAGVATFHASIDDFHAPKEVRYARGRFSPDGYYERAFDYSLLRRVLVEPFRMGGSTGFQLAGFDLERDEPREAEWTTGPADAVLIIDGVLLQRPELRGLWNGAIWVDAQPEERARRMLERDGQRPGSEHAARYEGAQRRYVREAKPNTAAWAILDLTDPDRPVRRYADFCSVEPLPL